MIFKQQLNIPKVFQIEHKDMLPFIELKTKNNNIITVDKIYKDYNVIVSISQVNDRFNQYDFEIEIDTEKLKKIAENHF